MENAIIYSLLGIVILVVVIIATLFGGAQRVVKTKGQKKGEIVAAYKLELQKALSPLKDKQAQRVAKKSAMLKKFSDELSRNIFFDKDEIREVLLELTKSD